MNKISHMAMDQGRVFVLTEDGKLFRGTIVTIPGSGKNVTWDELHLPEGVVTTNKDESDGG